MKTGSRVQTHSLVPGHEVTRGRGNWPGMETLCPLQLPLLSPGAAALPGVTQASSLPGGSAWCLLSHQGRVLCLLPGGLLPGVAFGPYPRPWTTPGVWLLPGSVLDQWQACREGCPTDSVLGRLDSISSLQFWANGSSASSTFPPVSPDKWGPSLQNTWPCCLVSLIPTVIPPLFCSRMGCR